MSCLVTAVLEITECFAKWALTHGNFIQTSNFAKIGLQLYYLCSGCVVTIVSGAGVAGDWWPGRGRGRTLGFCRGGGDTQPQPAAPRPRITIWPASIHRYPPLPANTSLIKFFLNNQNNQLFLLHLHTLNRKEGALK